MRLNTTHLLIVATTTLAACGGKKDAPMVREATAAEPAGTILVVRDTTIEAAYEATGVAEPYEQATLSTKLMGSVVDVVVKAGDRVAAGQVLARIDARDLEAKRRQVQAGIASAEAMHREAKLMADRMRALYADSAAPKAQLDAAEAGLARASAGVDAAHAGEAELDAVAGYAQVRAPFAGVITQRFVDPGAFAAPGAPLLTIQDDSRLRVRVTVAPAVALSKSLPRGRRVEIVVEGVRGEATIEGVVPTPMGNLYQVTAIATNANRALPAGGAATLVVPQGTRQAIVVPEGAVRREGDLTGVTLRRGDAGTRWVKLGKTKNGMVEVLSGLASGDTIVVATTGSAK